jgi:hypothetical protein
MALTSILAIFAASGCSGVDAEADAEEVLPLGDVDDGVEQDDADDGAEADAVDASDAGATASVWMALEGVLSLMLTLTVCSGLGALVVDAGCVSLAEEIGLEADADTMLDD